MSTREFDALYAAYHQTLHAYFLGRTGDAELALDLLQEGFVRVWRNMANLEAMPAERQRSWLFAVARNLVIDEYRASATRARTGEALVSITEDTSAPADADIVERDQLRALEAAIRDLPSDLRTVLALQVIGERSSNEIGELLGKPAGTVRYQLAEARRRLRREVLDDNT